MRRRQYLLLVVLTIVAGLVGGAVSSWVLMARIAVAEETKQDGDDSLGLKILKEIYEGDKKQHGKKIVTAEEFRLVDGDGNHRASLSLSPDGNSFLTLCDKDGTRVGSSKWTISNDLGFLGSVSLLGIGALC